MEHIFALIHQTDKDEYDFDLVVFERLADALLNVQGNCFVRWLDIRPMAEKFYTRFDNGEAGMPDPEWPYHGMIECGVELEHYGGSILVWVKGSDNVWSGYDKDDYDELQGDISALQPIKRCL